MFELSRRNNNHLYNYNPFREMEEFEKNFFGTPFDRMFAHSALAEFKTDITDEGDHYLFKADLPGFEKKDINIDISGDTLTIGAERHSEYEEKDKKGKFIHAERSYGKFSRQFDVSGVDTDAIKAKYENGVLSLELPKKEIQSPEKKKLEIE